MFKKIVETILAFRRPRYKISISRSDGMELENFNIQEKVDSFGGKWETYFGPGPYWEIKIWRE